ncbi:HsdR family type I site-specific deoxyribonuclease [Patescibacteria group bacterium]|nr:HsdR family type I site-specific deoxyribonuclease [Patescibacteria group bacterium]
MTKLDKVNFDETKQSQLPFVEMLINMGYRYIPAKEVMTERQGDTSKFILKKTAQKYLSKINQYEHQGKEYKFRDEDIAQAIDELENLPLEGLIDTSKKVYGMIMPTTGGKTIKVFHDGKNVSKSFRFVDFANPKNNDFAVTVEFEAQGKNLIRVDIAVFVNGIPFALIENKKSSVEVQEALIQHNRNQQPTHCPKLFVYPQLLIGANKEELKYGTTATPTKFYTIWRERDENDEQEWKNRKTFSKTFTQQVQATISKPINQDIYQTLLSDLNGSTYKHNQILDRLPTPQDKSVMGMFKKERLLDICKNFILYDAGIKKVMRYQQYFGIKKILNRVKQTETTNYGQKRLGGVFWHTQGSGKSLTMVMFVKTLIENPNITNPRILIVTDRKDLDRQIKGTFENAGLKKDVIQAKGGEHLLRLIKNKDLRVITTLIHKFHTASKKRANFVDKDKNIFVLIDEAHRTQSGISNIEMNRIIPNACYLAFTGTPLLRKEKSQQKFGSFIDKYTIDDALKDKIILPLIYEGRYVDLEQDKKEIDRQVSRLIGDLTPKQQKELQYKIKHKILKDNPQRITEIAYDIEKHYLKQFQNTGLKGQIVAPSKYSAILFQKYFEQNGKIQTALVISDENGLIDDKDEHKKEVEDYLKNIKAKYTSLLSYEKEVIESFVYNDKDVELLIVVNKLLTGFDAPRNTVLYLSREITDHNLLQAIARVNRLFDNKTLPKTAGFVIDYSENANNIKSAMELFGNYDTDDVTGTLIDVDDKIQELQTNYSNLHDVFKTTKNDDEAFIQLLKDEPTRKEFYEALNTFLKTFSECMVLQDFVHEFKHLDIYQMELKKFMNLRKTASLRYAERVDFSQYKQALIKIMDKNIKAKEAELLTRQISITDKDVFNEAIEEFGSDKSKAEAIAAQTERTIKEQLKNDPEYYSRFSKKISILIEQMRQKKIADIEALKQAKLISQQVLEKKDQKIPLAIKKRAGSDIFYRNLKKYFEQHQLNEKEIIDIVLDIFNILKNESIIDWQMNIENKRVMKNTIDDYLYDVVKGKKKVNLSTKEVKQIIEKTMELAQNNIEIF